MASIAYNNLGNALSDLEKYEEAIDTGGAIVNDRVLALAKRIAARRRKTKQHG